VGGTVVVGVVEEEEEEKERSWEERKEEKRWGLGWQGKWGRDGSREEGSGMGCFFSREKDAKAPTHVVVDPQRPELGLWLSFFSWGGGGRSFCALLCSLLRFVFLVFSFFPPLLCIVALEL